MKTDTQTEGWFAIATTRGTFAARITPRGLAELRFPGDRAPKAAAENAPSPEARTICRTTERALKAALAGRAPDKLPPLDWTGATAFRQSIWRELLRIDAGRTRSYGEVAARLRKPGAARAVGAACGANPVPVLVPCHRVLAGDGGLGGFSGGLEWKRRLLTAEAAASAE
jgi:O-6-methylguanine DNA methyltransferase